jgi:hypothetical protein
VHKLLKERIAVAFFDMLNVRLSKHEEITGGGQVACSPYTLLSHFMMRYRQSCIEKPSYSLIRL